MPRIPRIVLSCLLSTVAALAAAAPAAAESALEATPTQLSFAETELDGGGAPPQQPLSFLNGGVDTNVKAVQITGPDASSFKLANDGCSGTILESAHACELQVSFTPVSNGLNNATLELFESNGTIEVPLSGTGVAGTLSAPASLVLPSTLVGQNQSRNLNVAELSAASHVESVQIAGPDAGDFTINFDGCSGATLNTGNTCGLNVEFHPSSPGAKNAQLILAGDASNAPLTIALSGTGAKGPQLTIDAVQALLGDVPVGSSLTHTFTLTNTGDYPMGLQNFMVSGTPLMFPIISDSCSRHEVQPGASCTISVEFRPSTAGIKSASIILISESAGGITAIGIEGNGVAVSSVPGSASLANIPPPAPAAGPPALPASPLPRLIALGAHRAVRLLDTHVIALCPATVVSCQVHSTLVGRRAQGARRGDEISLGSSLFTLAGGHSAIVHARLSSRGAALLRRHHIMSVLATVVITGPDGTAVTRHTRLTLTVSGTTRRV